MSETATLAKGAALNPDTWADFVARLRHDCVGEGVREHHTADAVFVVQKAVEHVIPDGYGGDPMIFDGCESSETPAEFFASCCDENKVKLNAACDGDFLAADGWQKEEALKELLPDYSLIYIEKRWEHLNQHFTKEAAEAFISRKKHDYRLGLRIYVDCSCYSWELNAIKAAILDGRIGLLPVAAQQTQGGE